MPYSITCVYFSVQSDAAVLDHGHQGGQFKGGARLGSVGDGVVVGLVESTVALLEHVGDTSYGACPDIHYDGGSAFKHIAPGQLLPQLGLGRLLYAHVYGCPDIVSVHGRPGRSSVDRYPLVSESAVYGLYAFLAAQLVVVSKLYAGSASVSVEIADGPVGQLSVRIDSLAVSVNYEPSLELSESEYGKASDLGQLSEVHFAVAYFKISLAGLPGVEQFVPVGSG